MQKEAKEYSAVYEELSKIRKGSKEKIQKKKSLEELILAKMQSKKVRELKCGSITFSIKTCKKYKQLTKDKICDIISKYINEMDDKITAEDLSKYIWNQRESSTEDKLKYNKPKGFVEKQNNKENNDEDLENENDEKNNDEKDNEEEDDTKND
jgi:hypothetical protein